MNQEVIQNDSNLVYAIKILVTKTVYSLITSTSVEMLAMLDGVGLPVWSQLGVSVQTVAVGVMKIVPNAYIIL